MNQQNNQYEEAKSKMLESVKKGLISMDFAKTIFPDIRIDNDYERIRKCIRTIIQIHKEGSFGLECDLGATWNEILTWLEEQGKHLENFDEAEKEKSDFVGDGFVECRANFLDFKKGNNYWLEYIGDDKYNVRSDNLLCKTYHITPCQLYTIFKKPTSNIVEIPGKEGAEAAIWCIDECRLRSNDEMAIDRCYRAEEWVKSIREKLYKE